MASIGESLRTFIIAQSSITAIVGSRVYQNTVPQGQGLPYVWFRRGTSDSSEVATLDANLDSAATAAAQFRESFDIECVGDETDLDNVELLADAFKQAGVNYYAGAFGDGTVQGVYAEDHNDQYQPTNDDGDQGRHVASLELDVVGYSE